MPLRALLTTPPPLLYLDPLPEQAAPHGVVPVLTAREAERVHTAAFDRRRLHVCHLDGVIAVRGRTPT